MKASGGQSFEKDWIKTLEDAPLGASSFIFIVGQKDNIDVTIDHTL